MACESETRLAGIGSLMSGSSSCTAWLCCATAGSSHGLVATSYACVKCERGLQSPLPAAVCKAGDQTDCSRRPFQVLLFCRPPIMEGEARIGSWLRTQSPRASGAPAGVPCSHTWLWPEWS